MSRLSRIPRTTTTLVASALVLGLTVPVALAAPEDDGVASARASEAAVAGSVADIEVELARLSTVADTAWALSATAGERYVTAQVALESAQDAAAAADTKLAAAVKTMDASRQILAGIAIERYRSGGAIQNLEAVLTADGITDVVRRTSSLRAVGDVADAAVQQYRADALVADVLRADAAAAVASAQTAADEAEDARTETDRLTAAAQTAVDSASSRRDTLITQLAAARSTTVEAERARQDRIDRDREQQREDQAESDREPADRPSTPTSDPTTRPPSNPPTTTPTVTPTEEPSNEPTTPPTQRPTPTTPPTVDPTPTPTQEPTTEPTTTPPTQRPTPTPEPTKPPTVDPPGLGQGTAVGTAAQGRKAVEWARTQIGKMYGWGTTGPNTYDCSGLTMRAWEAAGVGITRTSRSQYVRVKKIKYSQMRPGDLIFWANDTSDPSTIRHVAMYTGGGMMIEAARPGIPVREVPVRYAETMAYAGRP
ncbi:NlpC/P60 family protein [Sanguibacter sp. HDW7]|uniref:C40 family peptidase n=1 Tax=Sanguibacter sp. HDW7 TaxID=2714931 RepID=UPI0014094608|nr:C40 family peptidase [Sanguibacter sp. HDW7]QIK84401.1 glycoside hydrolase [Sanguibacter sp. HDW7]